MGTQRTTFDKLQRERAKKAKAAEKRERRRAARDDADDGGAGPTAAASGQESAAELLVLIEALHKRFEAKTISFEDFEEQKADLFGRLAALPIE
jgi:hypothetical protein